MASQLQAQGQLPIQDQPLYYTHFGLVQRDPEVLKSYGMLLEDGDFSWLPPPKDMTLEENKKSKRKDNSVMPNLNDSLLTEDQPTDFAFRIQDLKIKVPKGSLVFVIGKIGSGKSSLLYALVGEMKKSSNPENKTRLYTGNNMAMLSQTPWLIGSSIKVNILLDLPYEEERFQRALRLSQLKDDVDNMADGIDTFIGENGSTVSGGQRTRIALARLIYQDPDTHRHEC